MPKYLSPEWVARHEELGARLPEAPGVTVSVEHVVPGSPDGEVRYVVTYVDGQVGSSTLGGGEDVDVSLTTKYADSVKLVTGELGANEAFMSGRSKVVGSTGKLLDVLALTVTPAYEAFRAELAADTEL